MSSSRLAPWRGRTLRFGMGAAIAVLLFGTDLHADLIRLAVLGIAGYAYQAIVQGLLAGRSDVRASFTLAIGGGLAAVAVTLLLVPRWGVTGGLLGMAAMFPAGI